MAMEPAVQAAGFHHSLRLLLPSTSHSKLQCPHARRARKSSLVISALPASPAARDLVEEDVLQLFLKERQQRGDFVSKVRDALRRMNNAKSAEFEAEATKEKFLLPSSLADDDDDSGGFLQLSQMRGWISGDTSPPTNKKPVSKDWRDDSEKRKQLNLLKYEALKDEMLLLTSGVGAVCTVYCLLSFSLEAAWSYAAGVLSSCLYLQLLCRRADNFSRDDVPEIFTRRKTKKIGIRTEDLKAATETVLSGASIALSSPRLVVPASIYGLWALSHHFHDFLGFQLVPGMMGFFAYKAAALVQVYRDNEDLRMIFPGMDDGDGAGPF